MPDRRRHGVVRRALRIPDLQQPKDTFTDGGGVLADRIGIVRFQAGGSEDDGEQRNPMGFHND